MPCVDCGSSLSSFYPDCYSEPPDWLVEDRRCGACAFDAFVEDERAEGKSVSTEEARAMWGYLFDGEQGRPDLEAPIECPRCGETARGFAHFGARGFECA